MRHEEAANLMMSLLIFGMAAALFTGSLVDTAVDQIRTYNIYRYRYIGQTQRPREIELQWPRGPRAYKFHRSHWSRCQLI